MRDTALPNTGQVDFSPTKCVGSDHKNTLTCLLLFVTSQKLVEFGNLHGLVYSFTCRSLILSLCDPSVHLTQCNGFAGDCLDGPHRYMSDSKLSTNTSLTSFQLAPLSSYSSQCSAEKFSDSIYETPVESKAK